MAYTNKVFRFGNFSFWFWILFIYILAALVWWFISLERQSHEMSELKLNQISKTDPQYSSKQQEVLQYKKRQTAKFIAEGLTFLALIVLGAAFVYRSILSL